MRTAVLQLIQAHAMLKPKQRLWVAVSGGVDSMVLLHLMHRMAYRCQVVHVNHGLRGEESDADADFVREQAGSLGLPCRVVQVDLSGARNGQSVQMAAREARYAVFRTLMGHNTDALALAHHADDLAETLLLNLMRGAGVHGWAGMRAVVPLAEGRICRPLLAVRRAEIMAYAREHGIEFREDPSNKDPKYLRNRVRNELLPLMEELRPGTGKSLVRAAWMLGEMAMAATGYAQGQLGPLRASGKGSLKFPLDAVRSSPVPRLLLRQLTAHLGPHPDVLDQLLAAIQQHATGAVFDLGPQQLVVERDHLVMATPRLGFPTFTISEAAPGRSGPFRWWPCPAEAVDLSTGPSTAWLDRAKLRFPLVLRPWRAGDRMRPIGLGGSKLVSDILTDARVPSAEKPGRYVLLSGGQVAWLAGLRIAEGFNPGAETQDVLRVEWAPPTAGSPY